MGTKGQRINVNIIPADLIITKECVYHQCDFNCTDGILKMEAKLWRQYTHGKWFHNQVQNY